jgi:hypothetical protein
MVVVAEAWAPAPCYNNLPRRASDQPSDDSTASSELLRSASVAHLHQSSSGIASIMVKLLLLLRFPLAMLIWHRTTMAVVTMGVYGVGSV